MSSLCRRQPFILRVACALAAITGAAMAQSATQPAAAPAGAAAALSTDTIPSQSIIGHIDIADTTEKIRVAGAVTLTGDSTLLGDGSTVTAGKVTLPIHLNRGGELDLCATTEVHLSQGKPTPNSSGTHIALNQPLMLAMDHGAIEAHYKIGNTSDVVLTPDLRILLSGPGEADVRIRVTQKGDTCVDNPGKDAPYVVVSEQIGTGVYRVQSNQRVLFEHGSVRDVVDRESEPCGCPANQPPLSIAKAGGSSSLGHASAKPAKAVAAGSIAGSSHADGPSSTPEDTIFPLAESEGLAAPPKPLSHSVPPAGQMHGEVTTTLSYEAPRHTVPTGTASGMATPESAATTAASPAPDFGPSVPGGAAPITPTVPVTKEKPAHKSGFFGKIGHFFKKIFG